MSTPSADSHPTTSSAVLSPRATSVTPLSSGSTSGFSTPPIFGPMPRGTPSTPPLTSKSVRQKIDSGEFVITAKTNGTAECWKTFGVVRRKPRDDEHDGDDAAVGELVAGFAACKWCFQVYTYDSRTTGINTITKHGCTKKPKPVGQPGIVEAMAVASAPSVVTKGAKSKISRAAAHFVARDLRAFSAVEGDGMAVFAAELVKFGQQNPKANVNMKLIKELLPSRNTVKNHVDVVGVEAKVELRKVLNNAVANRTAAFTTDQWTDDYKKKTYTDLTCYIIDDQFELQQYTLSCRGFPSGESKTAENIMAELKAILKDLNVSLDAAKQCFFTTDYGSPIIAALNILYKSKEYPENLRQGCLAHRINTILRTAWTKTESALESAKQFDTSVKLLVQYSKQSDLQGKLTNTLKKSSPTRWNSLYYTLASIKGGYAEIENSLRGSKDLRRLTSIDPLLLDQLTAFLEQFADITDTIEAEREPTLQHVVLAYYTICDLCEPDTEDDLVLLQFKEYVLQLLTQKLTMKSYHWIATFLDPRFKDLLMLSSDDDRQSKRLEIENALKAMDDPASAEADPAAEDEVEVLEGPPSKRKRDCFSKFKAAAKARAKPKALTLQQEIQLYDTMDFEGEKKLLSFWREQQLKLPRLSRIARLIYVIPATSASSERAFSAAGRVLEKRRTRLTPSSVDTILRVRSALKTSLVHH